jgi:hypothetical protein
LRPFGHAFVAYIARYVFRFKAQIRPIARPDQVLFAAGPNIAAPLTIAAGVGLYAESVT